MFDDRPTNFLTNQPLDDGEWKEKEVNDSPTQTVIVNVITHHGNSQWNKKSQHTTNLKITTILELDTN